MRTSFLLSRDKWINHNLTLYYQFVLTTKTSLLSLSTVDCLKDLNIGYHLPRRHRSSRGVKRQKQNLNSFIVASFKSQSVKGNDMACKRCEISTFIKDNGVDHFFVTETWLSAQGDEAKNCWTSTKWIWCEIIPTSIAISWRWNCYGIQIYFRL